MDVILIRHAEAGERDAVRFPDDDLRPVSPDGKRKMEQVARVMKKMGIKFDHLLSSPLVRALQTAEIVKDAFEFTGEIETSAALGHECTPQNVSKLLFKFAADCKVALVGHEPDFSSLAVAMIGADKAMIQLKKGGSIGIRFEEGVQLGRGSLLFHLRPSQLRKVRE